MDTLEVITFDSTLEDDQEFLEYVLQNKDVKILSRDAIMAGSIEVSQNRIESLWGKGLVSECSFLIWNTSISNPLCWSPYLMHYDQDCNPVRRGHPNSIKNPKSRDEFLYLHSSFVSQPITENLFVHGSYHCELSPMLEFDFPDKRNRFSGVRADFCDYITSDIWIIWDAKNGKWKHETRDIESFYKEDVCQPPEFIEWQEGVFDWVRDKFGKWIVPQFTYRLGDDNRPEERVAQTLANILGHNVAGFDPQPPVDSPRDKTD